MQSHLLEKASQVIKTPQVLINVISRRVRQLTHGHRALVEITPRMGFSDIALTEVIAGKVSYETTADFKQENSLPRIVEFAPFIAKEKAA